MRQCSDKPDVVDVEKLAREPLTTELRQSTGSAETYVDIRIGPFLLMCGVRPESELAKRAACSIGRETERDKVCIQRAPDPESRAATGDLAIANVRELLIPCRSAIDRDPR